jgi:plasmid stabilization system protein ParE
MKVRWSGPALEHLAGIRSYISESSPETAKNFIRSLYNRVSSQLTDFPMSGRRIGSLYREVIYKKQYRIIYSLTSTEVSILAVRNTNQNFSPEDLP